MNNRPSILEVVSRYLPLRHAGKECIGLCPFHDDTHPSLSVNEEKGLFHCWGCGESGDVIKFVQLVEKASFKEALSILGMAGLPSAPPSITPRQMKAAEIAAAWLSEQRSLLNIVLADGLAQIDLADDIGDGKLTEELIREQSFLRDLYADMNIARNAVDMLSIAHVIEGLTDGVSVPELHFEFPKLTPEYRARLKAIVEARA